MTVYGIQFWIECKGGLKTADELSDVLDDLVYDGNLSLGYSNHSIMGAGLFMKNAVQNNFESIREILNEFADKIKYVSEWDYENSSDIKWGVHILGESKKSTRKSIKESTDIFDTLENAWDKSTMNNNMFEKTVLKLKTDSFKDPFDKYSTIYMFADGSSIDCDSLDPFDCDWCTYVSEDLSFVHEFKK